MRKAIYTLGILALTGLSFASCKKNLTPDVVQEGKLVTVTFVAESPNTKTGILDEGTSAVLYKWTANDVGSLYLFTVGADNTLTRVEGISAEIKDEGRLMTITATVPEGSTVRAVLNAFYTSSEGTLYLPNSQVPEINSFDPGGDLLISDDEVVTSGMTEASLIFHRKTVVCRMDLNGLAQGEKLLQVVLSSKTTGKQISGFWSLAGNGWQGQETPLTLTIKSAVGAQEGSIPVYFTAIPNENVQLHIVAYTNQNVYEKDLNGTISFNLGQFTKFSVGLSGAGVPAVTETYTWMTANGDIAKNDGNGNNTEFGNIKTYKGKGSPARDWYSVYNYQGGIGTPAYGWDSSKGISFGSTEQPCTSILFVNDDSSYYVQSVRVCLSGTAAQGLTLRVVAGYDETPLLCDRQETVTATATPAYYTFTSTELLKGNVKLFIVNSTGGPFYIKSIEFNPTYNRGTAGQPDTVFDYDTQF